MLSRLAALWQQLVTRLRMWPHAAHTSPQHAAHRHLMTVLARRMDAYALPIPTAIYPSDKGWSIKVVSQSVLAAWGHGLGTGPATLTRWGLTRQRWRIDATVCGVPVEIWAEAHGTSEGTEDHD